MKKNKKNKTEELGINFFDISAFTKSAKQIKTDQQKAEWCKALAEYLTEMLESGL